MQSCAHSSAEPCSPSRRPRRCSCSAPSHRFPLESTPLFPPTPVTSPINMRATLIVASCPSPPPRTRLSMCKRIWAVRFLVGLSWTKPRATKRTSQIRRFKLNRSEACNVQERPRGGPAHTWYLAEGVNVRRMSVQQESLAEAKTDCMCYHVVSADRSIHVKDESVANLGFAGTV